MTPLQAAAGSQRAWVDLQGHRVTAEFVRFFSGQVVLKKSGGTVIKVNFLDLSELDQEYVRKQMAAKGQEDLLPSRPVQVAIGGPGAANNAADPMGGHGGAGSRINRGGWPQQPPIPSPVPSPAPPGSSHGAMTPHSQMTPQGQMSSHGQMASSQPPTMPVPSQMPSSMPMPTPMPPMHNAMPPMHNAMPMHAPMHSAAPPFQPQMRKIVQFTCGKCKQIVPSSTKAGDRCPNCKAYFDFVENEDGSRSYAPGRVWKTILGAVVVLIAVAAKFARAQG